MYFVAILRRLVAHPPFQHRAARRVPPRRRRHRTPPAGARSPRPGISHRSAAAGGRRRASAWRRRTPPRRCCRRATLAVGLVGAGRQDVVEHRAHLRLAPAAARLHVGEQPLDVADLRGDRLHVAHRLLHRGELVDHPVEALVHLLLDRGVELFVHGLLDFGELRLVALAHLAQPRLDQRALVAQRGGQFLAQPVGRLAYRRGRIADAGERAAHALRLPTLDRRRQRAFGRGQRWRAPSPPRRAGRQAPARPAAAAVAIRRLAAPPRAAAEAPPQGTAERQRQQFPTQSTRRSARQVFQCIR